ncbi:hypothetical protein G6F35_016931 [Rhizopus arrhizus]|nr:hypothetical protein G6F35_016931 [Rhizopus arrhizus]
MRGNATGQVHRARADGDRCVAGQAAQPGTEHLQGLHRQRILATAGGADQRLGAGPHRSGAAQFAQARIQVHQATAGQHAFVVHVRPALQQFAQHLQLQRVARAERGMADLAGQHRAFAIGKAQCGTESGAGAQYQ